AAMRNSMTPSCRPFRSCSMSSAIDIQAVWSGRFNGTSTAFAQAIAVDADDSAQTANRQTLHLAFARIGVAMLFECRGDDLVGQHIAFLDHFAHIDVLDRMVVVVELEG